MWIVTRRQYHLSTSPKNRPTVEPTSIHRSVPSKGRCIWATTLPRWPGQGRGRGGSRGRGTGTPAHIITAENPISNPAFRAQLSRIILGEIEWTTGRTLWNIDRGNVLTTRNTGRRLSPGPEVETWDQPHVQNILPETTSAVAGKEAENRVRFPDRLTDMRTQILNLLIFLTILNFALNIYILHHLVTIRFF